MKAQQSDKKLWLEQEDLLIKSFVSAQNTKTQAKIKWSQVADLINKQFPCKNRNGKQCRERWINQLNPTLKKHTEWTKMQQQHLFNLHELHGNKWALIANKLQGRTDNCVKNHLHSTLRKGIRKLNKYVSQNKELFNSMKPFKQILLNKLLAVADGKFQEKLQVKKQAHELSKKIKKHLIIISQQVDQNPESHISQIKNNTVEQIKEFNRNCKRRKGKMKKIIGQSHQPQSGESSTQKQNEQIEQEKQLQINQQEQKEQQKLINKKQEQQPKFRENEEKFQFQNIEQPTFAKQKQQDILLPEPIILRQNSENLANFLNNSSKLFGNNGSFLIGLQKSNGGFQNFQTCTSPLINNQLESNRGFTSVFLSKIQAISQEKNDAYKPNEENQELPQFCPFIDHFAGQLIKSIEFNNQFILSRSLTLSQMQRPFQQSSNYPIFFDMNPSESQTKKQQ